MPHEPTADEVWEILLEGRVGYRSAVSTIGPTETVREHLREHVGRDLGGLTFPEKKRIARKLNSGGIATGAIACILHLEDRKSTIDYWVKGIDPEETIGLDGRVRRPNRTRKTRASQPEAGSFDFAPRELSRKAVLDVLIELRRAEVPVEDRPGWLRYIFGAAPETDTFQGRVTYARLLRESGFTPSVIAPIVGGSISWVYKWTGRAGTEPGLRYGIRGTELGDGTEAENLF